MEFESVESDICSNGLLNDPECDQLARFYFNIWPLQQWKYVQSRWKKYQILDKPAKICKTFKITPNFAKSGHTALETHSHNETFQGRLVRMS